jgi:hypothetical protein
MQDTCTTGRVPPTHGGVSVLEQDLERFLRRLPGRPVFLVDFPPHGRRPAAPPPAEEPAAEDPLERRMASLAGLLEAGAGHLAVAARAHREQGRQAAVRARALAAFAACRPAAGLDRADAEVGAAAAASRAARPAALTAVSEWSVDEAMAVLGCPRPRPARCCSSRSRSSPSCRAPCGRCRPASSPGRTR